MSDSRDRSSDEWAGQSGSQGNERTGSLADLLGALLGGALQGGSGLGDSGQDDSGLSGLGQGGGSLGGLGQGGSGLGSLLGMLLGGGGMSQPSSVSAEQQTETGMGSSGDLLSALLGASTGGGMSSGIASLLTPLITPLAQKLGIPVEIAQIVVIFVLSKLLSGKLGQGTTAQTQAQYPSQQSSPSGTSGGVDLSSLLQQMTSGQRVDTRYLRRSGLTEELVQQTGLDPDTAEQSLQEVLGMLSGQMRESENAERPAEQSREDEGQEVTGTEVSGQVVDQRNGYGIGNVLVIALQPGVGVREFIRQPLREMAYTSVRTDDNGRFTFPQPLPKGQAYGLVVVANGYRDMAVESGLRIGPDMPEQAELNPLALMPD
jgi:hypothetical protein